MKNILGAAFLVSVLVSLYQELQMKCEICDRRCTRITKINNPKTGRPKKHVMHSYCEEGMMARKASR